MRSMKKMCLLLHRTAAALKPRRGVATAGGAAYLARSGLSPTFESITDSEHMR